VEHAGGNQVLSKEGSTDKANQEVSQEDQFAPAVTANGSKLLVSEPASKIKAKHFPFSNDGIEILVLLPDYSVPPEVLAASVACKAPILAAKFVWEYGLDCPFGEWNDIEVVTKPKTSTIATADVGKNYGLLDLDDYGDGEVEESDRDVEDHEDAGTDSSEDSEKSDSESWETTDD
jgi:hypothetical protein